MSWIKQCDRTFTHQRAEHAGLTAMAFWAACMSWSAHRETDGVIERDELEMGKPIAQFVLQRFDADERLWGKLFADELTDSIDELCAEASEMLSEGLAAKVRMKFAALKKRLTRPRLEPRKVLSALLERTADALLLKRPRGRGTAYTLMHPDRKPYLTEDGGYQISKAKHAKNREGERKKKERQRKRQQRAEAIAATVNASLSDVITDFEVGETVEQRTLSPGGTHGGDTRGEVPRDPPESGEQLANPDSFDGDGDLSSSSFVCETPTRPTGGTDNHDQVAEVLTALRAAPELRLLATPALALAAHQTMKERSLGLSTLQAAIRYTADEARWELPPRIANGDIREPDNWLRAVLHNQLRDMTASRASELAHDAARTSEQRARTSTTPVGRQRISEQRERADTSKFAAVARDQLRKIRDLL